MARENRRGAAAVRMGLIAVAITIAISAPAGAIVLPIKTRPVLKEYFETGDKPTQQQFANLIDSEINLMVHEEYPAITLDGIGIFGSTNNALRMEEGQAINAAVNYAPPGSRPLLAPLWSGQSGFLPLRFNDGGTAPNTYYGYLQIYMDGAPLGPASFPPIGTASEPPAIHVDYLVYEPAPNQPLTTALVPEPTGLLALAGMGLVMRRRRR